MYKASVRALMRYAVKKLNQGDASLMLKLASDDAVIAFPGDNTWATMFRPAVKSRGKHPSHRGLAECTAFAERFTDLGVQFLVEDILVNGPPWNTRVALRVQSFVVGADGVDEYNNRAIALLEVRWGQLMSWEDYEDTQRVAAWDERRAELAETIPAD